MPPCGALECDRSQLVLGCEHISRQCSSRGAYAIILMCLQLLVDSEGATWALLLDTHGRMGLFTSGDGSAHFLHRTAQRHFCEPQLVLRGSIWLVWYDQQALPGQIEPLSRRGFPIDNCAADEPMVFYTSIAGRSSLPVSPLMSGYEPISARWFSRPIALFAIPDMLPLKRALRSGLLWSGGGSDWMMMMMMMRMMMMMMI